MSLTWYKFLCFIRIALTLFPQTGYIHPDEHFQGPEVVYGDTLQLQVHKTWEFTTKNPIRTIVFPYLVVGFPSVLAEIFNLKNLSGTFLYPYLLLTIPRMFMCCLSFLCDVLIHKLCLAMGKNPTPSLVMFASSYTTIVYLTRTFSNCFEVLFYSLTIYTLCRLLHYKRTKIKPNYCGLMYISFLLGLIIVMGICNRPTFILFASFPTAIFIFLLFTMQNRLNNLVAFCLGLLCMLILLTSIDTLYYNKIHYMSVNKFYQNIVITPLNFILYNMDKSNLKTHGLHSHWLHLTVNIPLLFSIYGVFVLLDFVRCAVKSLTKSWINFKGILMLSFVVPLFLLSLVPHQEPRFLLPLIFPLSILHRDLFSHKIINVKLCTRLWYINNVLGILFFGFLHQGGVYSSLSYIHTSMESSCDVIYHKTYMPPRYLLGIPKSQMDVKVYDFAGANQSTVEESLTNITHQRKSETVYLITPHRVLNIPVLDLYYQLDRRKDIFPHLSMEDLPKFSQVVDVVNNNNISIWHKLYKMKQVFSIQVLVFKRKN